MISVGGRTMEGCMGPWVALVGAFAMGCFGCL